MIHYKCQNCGLNETEEFVEKHVCSKWHLDTYIPSETILRIGKKRFLKIV